MTTVDLSFPLQGERIPLDHGYALYGAISRVVPALHEAAWLGIHPLSGRPLGDGELALPPHAHLRLRLPAERIAAALPLAGSRLDVLGSALRIGVPRVEALVPAPSLDARLVAIKLTQAPRRNSPELSREALDVDGFAERYRQEIRRQLDAIGIPKPFELCGRRRLGVGGKRIVGYSVRVSGLSADESLRLQEAGLGGKRRMGCGVFRPTRGNG